MKSAIILNAAAGAGAGRGDTSDADRVREAFQHAGLDATVTVPQPGSFVAAVRDAVASDADIVVLGGGDGTLNAGAAVIVQESGVKGAKPLGVLPLGTLNHFAKDVGIPVDLDAAVETIRAGHVMEVDVGEVNGRIFLNNSSIGLYPMAVKEREELRHRTGGGKWVAMLRASVEVFRRFPLLDVTLPLEGREVRLTTPFVFVGNNRYEMSLLTLGTRSSLQAGELSVYAPRNGSRMGLLQLAFRTLIGRLDQARDFHSTAVSSIEIRTRRRSLRVSLDGEVTQMTSPIRFLTRPRALRVLAPAPAQRKAEE